MNNDEIRRAIGPLRLIFWGALICVLDFSINGFDLLNDVLGTILVTWGLFSLSSIKVDHRYDQAMLYVKTIAILSIFHAIFSQFPCDARDTPGFIDAMLLLFGIAKLVAVLLFCMAMRWFCQKAELRLSGDSWKTTAILITVIYVIPLGLFYLIALLAITTGNSLNINLGPAFLFLIIVFLVPLIHFFVSTSRMKREAAESQGEQSLQS